LSQIFPELSRNKYLFDARGDSYLIFIDFIIIVYYNVQFYSEFSVDYTPSIVVLDISCFSGVGLGPAKSCVEQMTHALQASLSSKYSVVRIPISSFEYECSGGMISTLQSVEEIAAVVFPGGHALEYHSAMRNLGGVLSAYRTIQKLVMDKGIPLICSCAGAIFVSGEIHLYYGLGKGPRSAMELCAEDGDPLFFDRKVARAIHYKEDEGIFPVTVELASEPSSEATLLFAQGPGWVADDQDKVHAWYKADQPPFQQRLAAIISRSLGKGTVVLVGPHVEYDPDYANGFSTEINDVLRLHEKERHPLMRQILKAVGLELREESSSL
jgi:glutamine amidotransferase-like uncharacterized protein